MRPPCRRWSLRAIPRSMPRDIIPRSSSTAPIAASGASRPIAAKTCCSSPAQYRHLAARGIAVPADQIRAVGRLCPASRRPELSSRTGRTDRHAAQAVRRTIPTAFFDYADRRHERRGRGHDRNIIRPDQAKATLVTVKMIRPTSPPTTVPLIRIYCRSRPTCSSRSG